MPLKFDATLKDLVRAYPRDWLAALGCPGEARLISSDLSSVSAVADLVFQRDDRLLHLDFQTGADATLPRRTLRYTVLLHEQFGLPVESFIVLLRRQADRSDLTGQVRYAAADGRPILEFRFELLRVWQRPAEEFLGGGLGLTPLATLGALPEGADETEAIAAVINRLAERITREAPRPEAVKLLTDAYILTGLRIPSNVATQLFRGVEAMRESSTYQAILEEGEAIAFRKVVLSRGRRRWGEPDAATRSALEALTDVQRLEALSERVDTVSGWQELLATP
jgi:predicted transposase YdaD